MIVQTDQVLHLHNGPISAAAAVKAAHHPDGVAEPWVGVTEVWLRLQVQADEGDNLIIIRSFIENTSNFIIQPGHRIIFFLPVRECGCSGLFRNCSQAERAEFVRFA